MKKIAKVIITAALISTMNLTALAAFTLEDMQGDFCYWDIPSIDNAYFNRARKLLLEAQARRQTE